MQGMERAMFSSCTIWKRYILEWNQYLKEKGSVWKLKTLTLYGHESINVVNRPLIEMQNYWYDIWFCSAQALYNRRLDKL